VQKLECHFNNFKLEHVPRGQDATVKEMSQIATQGLPVPAGAIVESCPSHPLSRKTKSLESCWHLSRGSTNSGAAREYGWPGK
jgi:hypothetical protein